MLDEVEDWRSRALDTVYSIDIYYAFRVKIRDKDSRIVKNKAVYMALGVSGDGLRKALGLWPNGGLTVTASIRLSADGSPRTRGPSSGCPS